MLMRFWQICVIIEYNFDIWKFLLWAWGLMCSLSWISKLFHAWHPTHIETLPTDTAFLELMRNLQINQKGKTVLWHHLIHIGTDIWKMLIQKLYGLEGYFVFLGVCLDLRSAPKLLDSFFFLFSILETCWRVFRQFWFSAIFTHNKVYFTESHTPPYPTTPHLFCFPFLFVE
jgi:hypothetical protein